MSSLADKVMAIKQKFDELADELVKPEILTDQKKYTKLNREYKNLKEVVDTGDIYLATLSNIALAKEMMAEETDPEMKEMAKMELDESESKIPDLEEKVKVLLIPKDPEDSKNSILEIRAGAGGDEASIFAGDLFRMYKMYAETMGWKFDVVNTNEGTVGGYKEITIDVSGANVYGILKYESGVHRVQRVPATESQGRVHTSASSVAVLPEADEVDFELNLKDVKKDTFRASGAGGQHVNKTESAVRLTHLPTNTVVECQDGRSQIKNYEKALTVLRTRLYEKELAAHNAVISEKRKSLVSTGDRSAKIRTYNYPQGRVTDHRINLTLYDLQNVMDGNIGKIIEALQIAENTEKLKETDL
jgi:peptide chain release factor 1